VPPLTVSLPGAPAAGGAPPVPLLDELVVPDESPVEDEAVDMAPPTPELVPAPELDEELVVLPLSPQAAKRSEIDRRKRRIRNPRAQSP
jgi:hypothetical protein